MSLLEGLKVEQQPRAAYTAEWVESDGGTYAESLLSWVTQRTTTGLTDRLSVVPEDPKPGSQDVF